MYSDQLTEFWHPRMLSANAAFRSRVLSLVQDDLGNPVAPYNGQDPTSEEALVDAVVKGTPYSAPYAQYKGLGNVLKPLWCVVITRTKLEESDTVNFHLETVEDGSWIDPGVFGFGSRRTTGAWRYASDDGATEWFKPTAPYAWKNLTGTYTWEGKKARAGEIIFQFELPKSYKKYIRAIRAEVQDTPAEYNVTEDTVASTGAKPLLFAYLTLNADLPVTGWGF